VNGLSISLRRALLGLGSIALAALLILLLIHFGRINWRLTLYQLQHASRGAFVKLLLLNCVLVYLSSEKWRSVDAALRRVSDPIPSRTASFAITSAGMALGLLLPVQLGMTAARTLGTLVYGSVLKRGTAGTLFEQSFDLLVVTILAFTSGLTWFFKGAGLTWTITAVAMTVLALLAAEPSIEHLRRLATLAAHAPMRQGRIGKIQQTLLNLRHSEVLNASLARRLVMLSIARFAVIVLMAGQVAEAIGVPIPLWSIAAAIPFVVIACLIAITPGGLGVNELTFATALSIFGTPFSLGAQWALANRVLSAASCILIGAFAACTVGLKRLRSIHE